VPVVVDCETLFALPPAAAASGYGDAVDRAGDLLGRSVLATGLLPARGVGLGARGVDMSGAGALPGQQPVLGVPGLVDQGTDRMRMGMVELRPPARLNRPCPEPDLVRYWRHVEGGYLAVTEHLRRLDRDGRIEPWLADFADCPIRIVCRDTGGYDEIGHMLWHPSSLHRQEPAIQRASELLARQAENRPGAPSDPEVIAAEIAELLDGDIPVFTTTARSGILTGPRGIRCGRPADLVAAALARWRSADPTLNRRLIRSTMASAYLNDEGSPQRPAPARVDPSNLEPRRRALAVTIIGQLATEAIRGEDGTVTWVAPAYGATGWSLRPLPPDLYSGLMGVAVALAGYRVELAAGRADPGPDVASLLAATLATLRLAEDGHAADLARARAAGIVIRPEPPGGYAGLGSRIWGWLLLHRLGVVAAGAAGRRAEALAVRIAGALAADETYDLLTGSAGAIVPLLALAAHTGDDRWRVLAHAAAARLRAAATVHDTGAYWPTGQRPRGLDVLAHGAAGGLGGLAHGAAGIGWALARLAATAPAPNGTRELAVAAFRWQETLYHPHRPGWQDLRQPDRVTFTDGWCHGAVGIGLIAADLLHVDPDPRWPDLVRRAVAATWPSGLGYGHSLCHGSLGAWELLDVAVRAGLAPRGVTPWRAEILTSLESHGPVTGAVHGVVQPGLMLGAGGVAYQLLRLHPECELPSVLLPDPAKNTGS
jgi:type 2 lantibiotic biosynthesis protein LanM